MPASEIGECEGTKAGEGNADAQAGKEANGSFREAAPRRLGGWSDDGATPLTAQARALYEGGTVPVRTLATLVGVSLRTLYHHAHKRGWTMRNAPPVKGGARNKDRLRALRNALLPKAPGGLAARDPDRQAAALARAARALPLAQAAHAQAVARRDSEAEVHTLAALVRALATLHGMRPHKPRARDPGSRYDLSPQELRIALARRMDAAVGLDRVAADRGTPRQGSPSPPLPPPSPSAASPPDQPSARARRTEIIIARLHALRRRPY